MAWYVYVKQHGRANGHVAPILLNLVFPVRDQIGQGNIVIYDYKRQRIGVAHVVEPLVGIAGRCLKDCVYQLTW